MRVIYVIEPDGWPCPLADCPPGPFMFEGTLCFKSEYSNIDSFNSAGENFAKKDAIVQPVKMVRKEVEE